MERTHPACGSRASCSPRLNGAPQKMKRPPNNVRRPRLWHILDFKSQALDSQLALKGHDLTAAKNPGDMILHLFFILMKQPALVEIRATQTMPGPGNSLQPLLLNGFTAMNALS